MHNGLTHINKDGEATMVDVSGKVPMHRTAIAECFFCAKDTTISALMSGDLPKGEALSVARIAGIQAAKNCGSLIPLCHPLPIEYVDINFERLDACRLRITSTAIISAKTGVEMEALTAVSIAALTLWDMAKAIDNELSVNNLKLLKKQKREIVLT